MGSAGPQNSSERKREQEQLIAQAVSAIENIQLAGQTARAQINAAKECVLDTIRSESMQKQSDDALTATKRSELIKKLGEAVKSGNFPEVQHIRTLLSEEEKLP